MGPEWGPAFIKTNAYLPFPIWIYLNGLEFAKHQFDKTGVAYEALDNGSALPAIAGKNTWAGGAALPV